MPGFITNAPSPLNAQTGVFGWPIAMPEANMVEKLMDAVR